MRYEIRDINPPANVRAAMELQAEAERRKRAQVSHYPLLLLDLATVFLPGLPVTMMAKCTR